MRAVLFAGILTCGLLIQLSEGATWRGKGECPVIPPGECQSCDCANGYYTCQSCGVQSLAGEAAARCYLDNTPYAGQTYPGCCNVDIVCRGNANFDESKMK